MISFFLDFCTGCAGGPAAVRMPECGVMGIIGRKTADNADSHTLGCHVSPYGAFRKMQAFKKRRKRL